LTDMLCSISRRRPHTTFGIKSVRSC